MKLTFSLDAIPVVVLAITLTIVSYYGAFIPGTYTYENTSFAVQGMGQDFFDLIVVVPVLLISWYFKQRVNKAGYFIFGGTLLYLAYSFVIYSFGVHFNQLFLFYCITLGLSLYIFILLIYQAHEIEIQDNAPVKITGLFFIFIAVLFYALWLKNVIPALVNNSIPKELIENRLIINPVHVLDMAILLPGLIFTAILLMRKHQVGMLLTPVFLVFTILLALALVSMAVMLKLKGISEDLSVAFIFIVLAGISFFLLFTLLKRLKIKKE